MATAKDEGARMGGGLEANGTLKYFRVELVLWGSLKRLRGKKHNLLWPQWVGLFLPNRDGKGTLGL